MKNSMWNMSIKALVSLRRKSSGRLRKWEEKPNQTDRVKYMVKDLKDMLNEIDEVVTFKSNQDGAI